MYQVAFVTADDILNVRSQPGAGSQVDGALAADADEVQVMGDGEIIAGSLWVPIEGGGTQGWVNGRYLTEQIDPTQFCQESTVTTLLNDFETAVATQNNQTLSRLTNPARGLRVRLNWWNPEIRIEGDDLTSLFENRTIHDWGVEDGSGAAITGTFSEIVLPLLQTDVAAGSQFSCNEIQAAATAGLAQLPDGYQNVNFYSIHRAPSDAAGFDWGTWVVGVERWNGRYTISYLVHFAYEI